jgi:hypothetical protein
MRNFGYLGCSIGCKREHDVNVIINIINNNNNKYLFNTFLKQYKIQSVHMNVIKQK